MRALVATVMKPGSSSSSDPDVPPGLEDTKDIKKKKNRNQSAKKKLIKVFNATEEIDDQLEKRQTQYAEIGTQTKYTLPHTCIDVAWVPSCHEAIMDVAEDYAGEEDDVCGDNPDDATVIKSVLDIDTIDEDCIYDPAILPEMKRFQAKMSPTYRENSRKI